jgi:uncharacterized protein GlcG (DUF336 family)
MILRILIASLMTAVGALQAAAEKSAAIVNCPATHAQLAEALRASVKPTGGPTNGGFDNNEWAALVDRQGKICAIAYSGNSWDSQWPGSRAIAAEKAYTANAFSLDSVATSTANLFWPSQPGGILYGLLTSNPVNAAALYAGAAANYGTPDDPLVGERLGGTTAFGGGLPLYGNGGVVGGLGASGDSSCADHNVAWRIRRALKLDAVPKGISGGINDGIIYDVGADGRSQSGFGHPKCKNEEAQVAHKIGAAAPTESN